MPRNTSIQCPLCGNNVPPGSKKCPVCGTPVKGIMTQRALDGVIAKRILKKLDSERVSKEHILEKLPEVLLPVTKIQCPSCGLDLQGSEAACPRCGVPLGAGQPTTVQCTQCGAEMPAGAPMCPGCGAGVGEEKLEAPEEPPPEEPPEEEMLPPPSPAEEVEAEAISPVRTERLQAAESYGLVNGRGAVNGTGLVNGTGMINGTKGEGRLAVLAHRRGVVTRWQVVAVLVAVVVVISTFAFLSFSKEKAPYSVDGDFGEWSDAETYGMRILSEASGINVIDWAVTQYGSQVYLYAETEGQLMGSDIVDTVYLFIDVDESTSTGYSISGIGADYLLLLSGWNGSVQSACLKEFGSSKDVCNWNEWSELAGVTSALEGNRMEAMAQLPVAISDDARLLLVTQNQLEDRSVSYTVPMSGGVLIVEQRPSAQVAATGLVPISASTSLMTLRFSCDGVDGTVEQVSVNIGGSASAVTTVSPFSLSIDEVKVVEFFVDTQDSAAPGDFVEAGVEISGIVSSFGKVMVVGDGAKAYVSSSPAEICVDGAFADWTGLTQPDSDLLPLENVNVDIDEVGSSSTALDCYFFVSVIGQMCGGSFVPSVLGMPVSGGGGGIIVPTRKTGEDFLRVYIDSDQSASTGYQLSVSSDLIGADFMLEVVGLDGRIVDKTLRSYSGGIWYAVGGMIEAANDLHRLEIGVSLLAIGSPTSVDFIVETTDWRVRNDQASWDEDALRTVTGGISALTELKRWVVDSGSTSATATAMSYQRKLFYDGVNFWSFYFDGTNTVYKYSVNGGSTWTAVSACFVTAGVDEVSIWYDSGSNIVYAVGDRTAASTNVYLQRGVVDPGGHTISWAGTDSTLQVSTFSLGGKNTYISKDANGYLWVVSTNQTQLSPSRCNLTAFRSASPDSLSSWTFSANLIAGNSPQANPKGSLIPAGSGSDMWAVYGYSGLVFTRKYTGTWSLESQIPMANTDSAENTNNAPPSALVDSNGVIHIVYGDGFDQPAISKPRIWYTYNSGSGWAAPLRIDDALGNLGNVYPTISLDTSTGNIFAFWILTNSAGVGITLVGKKNVSGVWTSLDLGTQTADVKQHLTSIYSVANENFICWQWTQNTTIPIHVVFDKIPEFSDLALPVLAMLMLFLVCSGRVRRRRLKPRP